MSDNLLAIRVDDRRPDSRVIAADGEIDLNTAPELEKAILAAFEGLSGRVLVVDLSGVTFMASAGLSVLMQGYEQAGEQHATVRMVVPHDGAPRRSLEITGLVEILPLHHSLNDAFVGCPT